MAVRSSTSLTLFLLVVCHSEVRFLTSATAATQCPACFKGLCNLSRNYTTEEVVEVFDAFYPNLLKYVPDTESTSGNVRSGTGTYEQIEGELENTHIQHLVAPLLLLISYLTYVFFICPVWMQSTT